MPDYTIKNLMEVEDSAADRGPDLEARFARKHLQSEHLGAARERRRASGTLSIAGGVQRRGMAVQNIKSFCTGP